MIKPELLAPAGNFEKGLVALSYGADAVYIGGENWGLRQSAGNFTIEDIKNIVIYAKQLNKKVYVVVNIYSNDEDLINFEKYLSVLDEINIDAVIFSDPGIFSIISKKNYKFKKHLSTQASLTNSLTAKFWKNLGVDRVVLGREVSIKEAKEISKNANIEVEMFIHGSMCMSFSGKCLISNFLSNRDANKGGCVQSCRWKYNFYKNYINKFNGFPFNSKDMESTELINDFFKNNITSLKIEGRMKSVFYLAKVVSTYRNAIDSAVQNVDFDKNNIFNVSNRGFTTGFLDNFISENSIRYDSTNYKSIDSFIGLLEGKKNNKYIMNVKYGFNETDDIFVLMKNGKEKLLNKSNWFNFNNEKLSRINPNSVVLFDFDDDLEINSVIFKR